EALVDRDLDRNAIPLFDIGQLDPLLVEPIDRGFAARAQQDLVAAAAGRLVLDDPQGRQTGRSGGAHEARAFAVRARLGRGFEDAGAEPLPAHFHETEGRDPADLDAR